MSVPDPALVRNVCLCGHAGSGKTTPVEQRVISAYHPHHDEE